MHLLSSLQNSDKMLGIADHFITSFCNEFNKFNKNVLKEIYDDVKEDMFDMRNVSKKTKYKTKQREKMHLFGFSWLLEKLIVSVNLTW